jgi:D-alanyl-D-alanine carboxypeptidase
LIIIAAALCVSAASTAQAASKYAAYVIDAKNGKVLFSSSADAPRYPASLTKMMTLYMAFDAMKAGRISKSTRIPVSRQAAAMAPSKLGLRAGQTISVEDAIYALVTKSANDAACALGEFLGGSEARFAEMMTARARQIGMRSTTFRNASGLPDLRQKTTARDMATLGVALREHFPQYYGYFKTGSFRFRGRRHTNHNKLLGRVSGVDGIKTGYTRASGFNLVSSVETDGRRIVAVVMGGRSGRARDAHMASLIRQFLPRASKSGSGQLIAKPKADETLTVAAIKPADIDSAPAPTARPDEDVAAKSLAAAEDQQLAGDAGTATEGTDGEDEVQDEAAQVALAETRKPDRDSVAGAGSGASKASEVETVAIVPVARPKAEIEGEDVDPIVTASPAPASSGWVIQVGSMPSEDQAKEFLARTKNKAGSVLASLNAYTEVFQKGSATYYRARFSGFDSKDDARDACSALKRKRIACYAVAN